MSKRGERECVSDIREAIRRIEAYTEDLDYKGFMKHTMAQDAVVRNLGIVGEAVKNLSQDFKKKHKHIEWRKMAGFRDRLIHDYFGVDWDILWNVVKEKLPVLKGQVEELLRQMEK